MNILKRKWNIMTIEMNILIFHLKYNTTFHDEKNINHKMNDQEKIIKEKGM